MPVTIDITRENVLTVMTLFLQNIMPSTCEVVVLEVNRVPEPRSADWVGIMPLLLKAIATPIDTYQDGYLTNPDYPGYRYTQTSMQLTFQLDFHGPNAGDNSTIFTTLFRSEYTTNFFETSVFVQGQLGDGAGNIIGTGMGSWLAITNGVPVDPLYCTEARQSPFINGEMEIEETWSIDADVAYSPTVTTGQDFAGSIQVVLKEIDATYPP